MPTESLFHNFVISDPAAAERFIDALEASERDRQGHQIEYKDVQLTDPDKIRQLMQKRKISE